MAKRQTIGERLREARGKMEVRELVRRIREQGRETAVSTIRQIEEGKTLNPGVKTVETICLGLGIDPIQVISLGLERGPEPDKGFTKSRFASLARKYPSVKKAEKPFIHELIEILDEQMDRRS